MRAAPYGQHQIVGAGKSKTVTDLDGVAAAGDDGRSSVDHPVPDPPCLVVTVVTGKDDGLVEARAQHLEHRSWQDLLDPDSVRTVTVIGSCLPVTRYGRRRLATCHSTRR